MKLNKLFLSALCCSLALFSTAQLANAADSKITATSPSARIFVQGVPVVFPTEDGKTLLPPISYQGSTYMPLRTVGQWMGKAVAWDAATQTVSLSGAIDRELPAEGDIQYQANDISRQSPEGTAQLRTDLTIIMDGAPQTFQNQQGQLIYPLTYLGSTYLPLRNIGALTGFDVTWHEKRSAADLNGIFLRTPITDAQKNDMLSFVNALLPKLQAIDVPMQQLLTTAFTDVKTAQGVSTRLTKPEIAYALIPQIKVAAEELSKQPALGHPLLTYYYGQIMQDLDYIVNNADTVIALLQKGAQPSIADTYNRPQEEVDTMIMYYTSADRMQLNCEWMMRMVKQDFGKMF